jgi:hypothetical protein
MPPKKHVFSKAKTIIGHDGAAVRLYENEVWAADDPVVKAHPDAFSSEPTTVRRTPAGIGVKDVTVEEATAEPGAKRTTTRD